MAPSPQPRSSTRLPLGHQAPMARWVDCSLMRCNSDLQRYRKMSAPRSCRRAGHRAKGIVPGGVDLGIAHAAAVVEQGLDDLAAALGRKRQSVVKLTSKEFGLARASARVRLAAVARAGSK